MLGFVLFGGCFVVCAFLVWCLALSLVLCWFGCVCLLPAFVNVSFRLCARWFVCLFCVCLLVCLCVCVFGVC